MLLAVVARGLPTPEGRTALKRLRFRGAEVNMGSVAINQSGGER